jgi:glycosyltransferase involved in cell wall biosynthesis
MRVLAMLHLYAPAHCAGAEMMAHAMFRSLVERGHQVDVVLSQVHREIAGPYELDGVKVWPRKGKSDVLDYLDDADVIVTHLENTTRATILAGIHGVPIVHLLHNTMEPTRRWIRPYVLCVYNSEWMRRDFAAWFASHGSEVPRGIVVRPPVYANDYATTPGKHVTLVNMYAEKGSKTFWELAKRMPDVDFLAVVGAYGKQDLHELPNVEVVPHTSFMRDDVYARTRVLLMPSSYESWGRTGVEAMASGIPVIAHPTPGLKESLGDAGIFIDRNDVAGWQQGVRSLLDGRRWGAASRKALKRSSELDPDADLARWCGTMEEVAANGTRRPVRA